MVKIRKISIGIFVCHIIDTIATSIANILFHSFISFLIASISCIFSIELLPINTAALQRNEHVARTLNGWSIMDKPYCLIFPFVFGIRCARCPVFQSIFLPHTAHLQHALLKTYRRVSFIVIIVYPWFIKCVTGPFKSGLSERSARISPVFSTADFVYFPLSFSILLSVVLFIFYTAFLYLPRKYCLPITVISVCMPLFCPCCHSFISK